MAIFRGTGGQGDSTTDTTVSIVTQKAVEADASATAAASSATSAANSASSASTSETNAATSATNAATSATNASASETNAATSATSASASATTATTKASEASTSATSAATSATAAQTAQTAAETAQTAAETAETNALASATTATTKASEAATSATASATSATNAATSATSASTAQTAAETAQTAAETAKTGAETAETNAATSATSAASSATSASTSATTATTKASEASTSASNAATSETNASNSATSSATSATNSATSATSSATSATNAATSATNAATSETNAASSASTASTNATLAFNARVATEGKLDQFDDRYLGSKTSDPTLDNDGDALLTGALYWNSTDNLLKIYTGSAWVRVISEVSQDTTPELGGNLNLNSNDITGTGNINVTGTLQTSGNATIGGNLTVSGSTTTVNTEEINLADNNILLNSNHTGTPTQNAGLTVNRGNATNKVLQWNEASDYWEVDDAFNVSGNITVTGTVDGRDIATDGTKLDGIEANATADQTNSEIKTAYENNSDTNAFTDAEQTKLSGIETGATADQTASEILTAIKTVDGSGSGLDADLLDGNEASAFATSAQGSTADSALQNVSEDTTPQLGGNLSTNGNDIVFGNNDQARFGTGGGQGSLVISASSTESTIAEAGSGDLTVKADTFKVTNANGLEDMLIATPDAGVALYHNDVKKLETTSSGATVTGALSTTGGVSATGDLLTFGNVQVLGTVDGRDVAADGTKLDGIESSADVTDATNVAAAGALMDSEVTNLAQVKAFDSSDYATAAQGTTADAALPKAGGTMTGNLKLNDSVDVRMGTGNDFKLLHNGTNAKINNNTGALQISNFADNNDVTISADDGSGGTAVYFRADGSTGDAILSHYGIGKIKTQAGGVDVTGDITVSGTVDGRDVAADGTKLDGIAASATANPNAIDNVVEDTTPQLGGDLDVNNNNISLGVSGTAFDTAGSGDVIEFADSSQTFGQIYTSGFAVWPFGDYKAMHITNEHASAAAPIYLSSNNSISCRINDSEKFHVDANGIGVTGNIDVSGTVDGKNVSACIEGVVDDPAPQLGADLDANGNDIKLDANEKIYFGDSTDPDVHFITYDTSDDVLKFEATSQSGWEFHPYSGGHSFKLAAPQSAGGWTVEVAGNATGGTITTNYNNASNHAYFQKNGTTKISLLGTGEVRLANLDINGAYTFPTSDGSANQILKTDGSGTLSFSADSGQTLIAQGTVNNATSIDFNSSILTGYDQYRIELTNVQPASDFVELRMRFGTNNSADATTGRYAYGTRFSGRYSSNHYTNQMGTAWFNAGAASSYAVVAGSYASMGTNTGETLSTTLYLSNPNSTTKYKIARTETVVYSYFPMILDNDSSPVVYNQTSALNFVNFFAASGAISGTYRVYGIS